MKRPLLKILPGVAVVLISTSCNKDSDYIAEDNTALVAEQKIEHKVFYLKVNIESSLSKMTVEGLGTAGKRALKFEIGDRLTLRFDISLPCYFSGSALKISSEDRTFTVETTVVCNHVDGTFMGTTNNMTFNNVEVANPPSDAMDIIQDALEEMERGEKNVASKYNIQLTWGSPLDFSSNQYYGYDNPSKMFAAAPRSADKSFTLKQNGDYCFIVFEDGSTKTVTINGNSLSNSQCYIVASDTEVTVTGATTTNTITTASGKLYYVRKQAGDANNTLQNPGAGKTNEVDL